MPKSCATHTDDGATTHAAKRTKVDVAEAVIAKAKDLLKIHCDGAGIDDSHGTKHALAVLTHTEHALAAASFDMAESRKLSVRLAALLHDADDHKYFGKAASKAMTHARRIMEEAGAGQVSDAVVDDALSSIALVSCSANGNSCPDDAKEHPEILWPRWSDRLEASGEIGVARCFMHNRKDGAPLAIESTPRPTTAEEVFALATEERFADYQTRGGASASMIDHYYDKLIQVSRPAPELVRNKYLEEEARERVEPLVAVLLKYSATGKVPVDDIEAIMTRLGLK